METKYTAEQIDETLVTLRKEGAFKRGDLLMQQFSFAEAFAADLREREKDAGMCYCQEGVTCTNCEREALGGVSDELAGRFHDDLMRREGSARRWGSMGEWQRGTWRDALQAVWPVQTQQAHSDAKERGDFSMDVRHLIVCDAQFDWAGETTLKLPEIERLIARGWLAEGHENAEYEITDAGRAIIDNALSQAQHGEPVAWLQVSARDPNNRGLSFRRLHSDDKTGTNGWREYPLYTHAERPAVPDGYRAGYRAAMNDAASGVRQLYVQHCHHHGVDGLINRCMELEQSFIRDADAMLAAAPQPEGGES